MVSEVTSDLEGTDGNNCFPLFRPDPRTEMGLLPLAQAALSRGAILPLERYLEHCLRRGGVTALPAHIRDAHKKLGGAERRIEDARRLLDPASDFVGGDMDLDRMFSCTYDPLGKAMWMISGAILILRRQHFRVFLRQKNPAFLAALERAGVSIVRDDLA